MQVRAGLERRSSLPQLDIELLHLKVPLPENLWLFLLSASVGLRNLGHMMRRVTVSGLFSPGPAAPLTRRLIRADGPVRNESAVDVAMLGHKGSGIN